jgi:diguanylate cyclase (GGDEF)-like protein/PAS domain S-box-containing protein
MSDRVTDIRDTPNELRTIFDALSDGLVVCDMSGTIIEVNETACSLFAASRPAMLGRSIGRLAVEPASEATTWLGQAEPGGVATFEWQAQADGGRRFWAEIVLRRVALSAREVGLGVVRDITERKQTLDSLMLAARRDLLTGLPNRQDLEDILQHEIARYERYGGYLCIAVGQIDELTTIANTSGRHVAEDVFKRVAGFLRDRLRKSDYLARFGDAEFALLIHDARPDNAARMLNRMRNALQHQPIPELGGPVNMSFGLTAYRLTDTPHELLTRLSQALALTSKTGHHRIVTG